MTYKGKSVDAKEIGRTLGVRYVLEGSVQRDGHRVRVNAQLIGTDRGDQIWAESLEADMADLFKLQDDIVARLSRALQIELVQAESRRSIAEMRQDPDAVDLAMRGWSIMYRTPAMQNDDEARGLFQRALTADPKNVEAIAGLAYADMRDHFNGWNEPGVDKGDRAMAEAERAIALDPKYAYAYYIKGNLLAYAMKPNDEQAGNEAMAAAEAALSINPSFAPAFQTTALVEQMFGRYEQAIVHLQQAMRLSPRDYLLGPWLMQSGRNHFGLHQYDLAIRDELRSLDTGYHTFQAYLALAGAYAANGEDDKAKKAMKEALKANPKLSAAWLRAHLPTLLDWPPGMLEALRKAGLPEE